MREMPRRIKRRDGGIDPAWAPRILCMPHILAGAFILNMTVVGTVTELFGYCVPGFVVSHARKDDAEDGTSYSVRYGYAVKGHSYGASASVSRKTYNDEVVDGMPVIVRVNPFTPEHMSSIPKWSNPATGLAFMWFFSAGWNLLMLMLVYLLFVIPLRKLMLLKNGQSCEGEITQMAVGGTDETPKYQVYYRFQPRATFSFSRASSKICSAEVDNIMDVRADDYQQLHILDKVTVIYDPRNPSNSVIFQCSDYVLA